MDYFDRFSGAIERTIDWNLVCDGLEVFGHINRRVGTIPSAVAPGLVESMMQLVPMHPKLHVDCAGAHTSILFSTILSGWPVLPVITIGDVRVDGEPRYGTDEKALRDELKAARGATDVMPFHVWLTYPDLAIWDATFLLGLHLRGEPCASSLPGNWYYGPPGVLEPTLVYEPWLVGEKFLFMSGTVAPDMQSRLGMAVASVREFYETSET